MSEYDNVTLIGTDTMNRPSYISENSLYDITNHRLIAARVSCDGLLGLGLCRRYEVVATDAISASVTAVPASFAVKRATSSVKDAFSGLVAPQKRATLLGLFPWHRAREVAVALIGDSQRDARDLNRFGTDAFARSALKQLARQLADFLTERSEEMVVCGELRACAIEFGTERHDRAISVVAGAHADAR